MLQALNKIEKVLHRILVICGDIGLVLMLFCCVLQVITRFIFNDSLTWTEELARFSFIWISFLGAALCVEQKSHARISVVSDLFPKSIQKILDYVTQVLVIVCSCVMFWQGLKLLNTVSMQTSPMLEIPMSVFYGAAPTSAVFMGLYAFIEIIRGIFGSTHPETV